MFKQLKDTIDHLESQFGNSVAIVIRPGGEDGPVMESLVFVEHEGQQYQVGTNQPLNSVADVENIPPTYPSELAAMLDELIEQTLEAPNNG